MGDSTFAVLVVVYVAVGSAAPIDGTAAAVVDTTFAVDAAIAVGAAAVAVGSTSYIVWNIEGIILTEVARNRCYLIL